MKKSPTRIAPEITTDFISLAPTHHVTLTRGCAPFVHSKPAHSRAADATLVSDSEQPTLPREAHLVSGRAGRAIETTSAGDADPAAHRGGRLRGVTRVTASRGGGWLKKTWL